MNLEIAGPGPSPKVAQPFHRLALTALLLVTSATAPAMAGCTWDDLVQDGAQVASLTGPAARIHFVRDAALTMGENGRTLPFQAGKDDVCSIRMGRRGPYLLARNNMGCEGANGSFSDFHRRASR